MKTFLAISAAAVVLVAAIATQLMADITGDNRWKR